MHWKGGPRPLQGAQPMAGHCPPDVPASMAFVTDSNRPNRFGTLLQPVFSKIFSKPFALALEELGVKALPVFALILIMLYKKFVVLTG